MAIPAIVSRETSVLRPQPTMVGWGLSVLNLVVCECCVMPRGASLPRVKRLFRVECGRRHLGLLR